MSEPLTLDQVRHVAKLARLALPPEQLEVFTGQLGSILGYVEQLRQADVAGVEPLAHAIKLTNVLRDDEPTPALPVAQVLQNAPATDGPFFKVPAVMGADEDSAG
ncbi:MAG: asparaginyl/glutamyl-tRNA amidotransferase subunit [Phycisphaerales bacterium]|nr:asparaginyl/glutamyl-tRNA amidotransferase subunit [Phycisphaerales bacterium]